MQIPAPSDVDYVPALAHRASHFADGYNMNVHTATTAACVKCALTQAPPRSTLNPKR